jgi:hypothetical protein
MKKILIYSLLFLSLVSCSMDEFYFYLPGRWGKYSERLYHPGPYENTWEKEGTTQVQRARDVEVCDKEAVRRFRKNTRELGAPDIFELQRQCLKQKGYRRIEGYTDTEY